MNRQPKPAPDTRFLHVANGSSTTRLIAAAGIPGEMSLWADVLYEGPVPGGLSDESLMEIRRRYLSGEAEGADASLDPSNDLRQWRATIARHDSYDELVLWFEHDLFDQLNLIQLLPWICERVPAEKVVSLICAGSFPGRPNFKGLGELTPGELGSLLEARTRVTDEQYSVAQRAWHAFRESTPEALDALRREDTSALPYLAAALTRFLEEYPWTTDGLSRTERRLLHLASADGITLFDAFPRMHDDEDAYYVTDLSLAGMAEALSRTSPPLLTLTAEEAPYAPLAVRVTLTTTGAAILAGKQDRGPIDRWFGGVHLHPGAPVWKWDPARDQDRIRGIS